MAIKVAVVVGSLRKGSFSRMVAKAIEKEAPSDMSFEELSIRELPHFDQDLEAEPPKEWVAFREKLQAADAVLFVTPEYNRSVPGVLKNAIDVGSRPYGSSSWAGKPAAVVSTSVGAVGGFGANHHLRQSLVFLGMPTMTQPEAYVGNTGGLFGEGGELKNEDTKQFLATFAAAFDKWVRKHA